MTPGEKIIRVLESTWTPQEKLLAVVLLSHGERIYPSNSRLARLMSVGTRTVFRVKAKLVGRGELTVKTRYRKNGSYTTPDYRLDFPSDTGDTNPSVYPAVRQDRHPLKKNQNSFLESEESNDNSVAGGDGHHQHSGSIGGEAEKVDLEYWETTANTKNLYTGSDDQDERNIRAIKKALTKSGYTFKQAALEYLTNRDENDQSDGTATLKAMRQAVAKIIAHLKRRGAKPARVVLS